MSQDAFSDRRWFPVTNRATRRHCDHLWKTIGRLTACVLCGEEQSRTSGDAR